MKKKIATFFFILICTVFRNISAQSPLSEYLPNAHSIGLGWSAVAFPVDPSAGYWNPASLAFLTIDKMIININDVSRFDLTGFTKFFPPKIGLSVNTFHSSAAGQQLDFSTFGVGYRINSAVALGSNVNFGRNEKGEVLSSFGFGVFMKSYPDFRHKINSSNHIWRWFRSQKMKDKISLGFTFHNIPIQNIKNVQQMRAAIALKLSNYAPLLHFAYHLSPKNYSLHFGTQFNVIKNIDLYFGTKDFDVNQMAIGSLINYKSFTFELCYLPETKQYYFSIGMAFSDNRKELSKKYKNKGALCVKDNDYISGLKEYEKAIAYNPEDDKLNLLISILENRVELRKNMIDSLITQATKYEKKGWYDNVFHVYKNIIKIDPKNKTIRKRLKSISSKLTKYLEELFRQGVVHYKANEIKQADRLFEKILSVNKAHEGALNYSTKIDSIYSHNFDQHYLRGIGFFKQKNYSRANEEFEKALNINPEHESTLEYKKLIDKVLEKKQERINRLLAEAKKYEQRNSFIRAYNRYKQILGLDRTNEFATEKVEYLKKYISSLVESKYQRAKQLLNKKEYSAAIVAFKDILSIEPSHRASKKYLKIAQKSLTDFIEEHFAKAQNYFDNQNWQKALEECNIIFSFDNKYAAAQTLKAKAMQHINLNQLKDTAMQFFRNKNYRRAKEVFSQIIARSPDDQTAKQNLRECEKELNAQIEEKFNRGLANYSEGEYQDAIEVWTTVLNLDPNHKSTLEYIQKAKERLKILNDIK